MLTEALAPMSASRWGGVRFGHRMVSSRAVLVDGRAEEAFAPIQRIGGDAGWYAADWFWRLRGWVDTLRGGAGQRRGRRDPDELTVGESVDFWRVVRLDPGRRLLLAVEMELPGRLWLQFDVEPDDSGTHIRQTTVFDPRGYVGRVYWYLLYPIHRMIFRAMLRGCAARALSSGPDDLAKALGGTGVLGHAVDLRRRCRRAGAVRAA
ncbi:MAG: DUF2867 domain-containing protein [Solirubrobacteraceae bacterium]